MRQRLRARLLLPFVVVVAAGLAGLFTAGAAHATPSAGAPAAGDGHAARADATAARSGNAARSTPRPIKYQSLPSSYIAPGRLLFESTCSTCHGTEAEGSAVAPVLRGLGPATVDFWVSTGRMPLTNPTAQPLQKPPRFDRHQTLEIAAFVASLAPISPDYPTGIPSVDTKSANLAEGFQLFVLNCAACHTITGSGDALAEDSFSPSLHKATKTEVAEAIRTGPDQMPHFGPGNLSDQQVADIVAYVTGVIQHQNNRGGISLGGIGPVAEGFVGLLIGVGGLMLIAFWIGERS